MSRKQSIQKAEMLNVSHKLALLAERMCEAISKIEDDGIVIDGWPSAIRGATLVREQFVKVIGEANLRDVQFDKPDKPKVAFGSMVADSPKQYEQATGSKPRKKPES
jgi:hypothetical protein